MWAEAMAKLEGMHSTDRERLWPQLVQGFKDLSNRLKVFVVYFRHGAFWLENICILLRVVFMSMDKLLELY